MDRVSRLPKGAGSGVVTVARQVVSLLTESNYARKLIKAGLPRAEMLKRFVDVLGKISPLAYMPRFKQIEAHYVEPHVLAVDLSPRDSNRYVGIVVRANIWIPDSNRAAAHDEIESACLSAVRNSGFQSDTRRVWVFTNPQKEQIEIVIELPKS